jgi:chromosome segregation ATPase
MLMPSSSTLGTEEITELRSRLEWLDEERRKTTRKLAEFEQRLTLQERELASREQRIKELENSLTRASSQITQFSQIDTTLRQFKDELVQLIEQYDARRISGQQELDKIRRVEHETVTREIADIRKELPKIGRLEKDMELRQAEESRLANLIGLIQGRFSSVENQAENFSREMGFLEESEKKTARTLNEIQTSILETNKRMEPLFNRQEITALGLSKTETAIQEIVGITAELRQSIQSWAEQVQIGEYERNQRLDNWQRDLDAHKEEMARFTKEWVKFSDGYKEAKMAVQTLSEWQKQIENQQREVTEMTRVEGNRIKALWDRFELDNEKRWKSEQVEREQRWSGQQRQAKQISEQLHALDEALDKLNQENDTLKRIQTAQADAMKKFPRIWMEEVEKAIAHNPNSRRQPALVPVREE